MVLKHNQGYQHTSFAGTSLLRRHSLGSSRNLPPPRTSADIPCLLFARVPITTADFAPKIGWRSRENNFTTNRRRLRWCPHNRGKVTLVSIERLWVQSSQISSRSLGKVRSRDRDTSKQRARNVPLASVDVRGGGRFVKSLENVCVGG